MSTPEDALQATEALLSDSVSVIGGARIYTALLERCERVYLTKVDAAGKSGCVFSESGQAAGLDGGEGCVSERVEENGYTYRFVDDINGEAVLHENARLIAQVLFVSSIIAGVCRAAAAIAGCHLPDLSRQVLCKLSRKHIPAPVAPRYAGHIDSRLASQCQIVLHLCHKQLRHTALPQAQGAPPPSVFLPLTPNTRSWTPRLRRRMVIPAKQGVVIMPSRCSSMQWDV